MKSIARTSLMMASAMFLIIPTIGCENAASREDSGETHNTDDILPSNRVAIPTTVRSNLGITFARVERRQVENTLRVPGRFEYLPTAVREYRSMLPGRIEILVEQFQKVDAGTTLFRIDSPQWREMQQSIAQADANLMESKAQLASYERLMAAHAQHDQNLIQSIKIWSERVKELEVLVKTDEEHKKEFTIAQASLSEARAKLSEVREEDARLYAERVMTENRVNAAQAQFTLAIDNAASMLDVSPKQLLETSTLNPNSLPIWRRIKTLEVRAKESGVVEKIDLTNGTWVEIGENILTMVQPVRLRFHAFGLQSDLGALKDGLMARIVPPVPTAAGTAIPIHDTMSGRLQLGLEADTQKRTIDLYVTPDELSSWARPGVSAQLEIITESTETSELAVPMAAVQQDGLIPVIFRRDPDNPNQAIRIEADLGMNDDRWVAVLSGLRDGDEVVLDGGFQLMLATSGTIQKGGHFHADGTYHEGDH
ncbi:MAG: hypothetical protein CMJ40_03370 [Phycisphaerae bacterium]|nr:hypothetical protein [Phycisphaerae bacterium]